MLKAPEEIVLSTIQIDDHYQRQQNRKLIDSIAKNFRWDLFGQPVVSKRAVGRGFEYWDIDGQHRIVGAIEAGYGASAVLCAVHVNMTLAQEAALFRDLNSKSNRKSPKIFDDYKAGLCQGDLDYCEINRIVTAQGLRVTDRARAKDSICAIQTLINVLGHRGSENLCTTLQILKSWQPENPVVFQRYLIILVSEFLALYSQANPQILARSLVTTAALPEYVVADVRGVLKRGCTIQAAARQLLAPVYNHRLAMRNRLPEWG